MKTDDPGRENSTGSGNSLKEDVDYQVKLLSTSFEIRIFGCLLGLICANVLKDIIGMDISRQVMETFYVWLLTGVLYLAFFKSGVCKTKKCTDNVHFSYYFLGVSYATVLAHYLGGAEWIAFFIYLFDLVYANVLLRRLRGSLITAFIVICYFSLLLLEYMNIIPHRSILPIDKMTHNNLTYFLGTNVIVIGAVFFLLSYSTGLFSKMKEERERDLLESKNRFVAKSCQLEEMTRALRKKVAENRYLKRATMGYLEKKEFELEAVKKDLEDRIEKLRKTQKSMFFMIEDLNEMSAQLKDTRDHLEDKVRERTDELLDISRKLHRSERLAFLGKLAGSVTHELRNPLAVLKNAAYFLDKRFREKKDAKVLKYVGVMNREIRLIDSIIDDIMGFAQTKAPELQETDVRDTIENAVSAIEVPELVEIRKEYEELPKIKIDCDQVMHAIMNIANNAIVAMNGNGTLTFRALRKDDDVCIEVEDTGPGIPPDQRDLIFEPLYSSKPKGTGLGLPISKMMVENQEGRIEFESELGKGTVFRIYLPISRKGRGGER